MSVSVRHQASLAPPVSVTLNLDKSICFCITSPPTHTQNVARTGSVKKQTPQRASPTGASGEVAQASCSRRGRGLAPQTGCEDAQDPGVPARGLPGSFLRHHGGQVIPSSGALAWGFLKHRRDTVSEASRVHCSTRAVWPQVAHIPVSIRLYPSTPLRNKILSYV